MNELRPVPPIDELLCVFLEMSSRRKLIGYVEPILVDCSSPRFQLYYPVEVHVVTMDLDRISQKIAQPVPGFIPNMQFYQRLQQDAQTRDRVALNAAKDESPLIRFYNEGRDGGAPVQLFYVYLPACDYAKPLEPLIMVNGGLVETVFQYSESIDPYLKLLYDIEVRKKTPELPDGFIMSPLGIAPAISMPVQPAK